MQRLLMLVLFALFIWACHGDKPDPAMTEEPREATPENATDADEIRGVAGNAKAGAVILMDDGRSVYVEGLREWPEDVLDEKVVARGTLEQTNYVPDPVVTDSGAITAGAAGEEWVLRDPDWSLD